MFESLSQDLLMMRLIHKLFPGETSFFKGQVSANVTSTPGIIFYTEDQSPISPACYSRHLAYLLALSNSGLKDKIQLTEYQGEKEAKIPEPKDLQDFIEIIQA
jgi:hypothetical protein